MFYSYVYSDPVTNIPFYVGKGTGSRAYRHLSKCHNIAVHNKIQKLKQNNKQPFIDIIETSTEEFAFLLEKGLVKYFGRVDQNTGTLFNFTDGGEFTGAKKGRPAPNKGKKTGPLSEKHKAKLSASRMGYKKGVAQIRVSCLFCKKEGGYPIMATRHLDKCKLKGIK